MDGIRAISCRRSGSFAVLALLVALGSFATSAARAQEAAAEAQEGGQGAGQEGGQAAAEEEGGATEGGPTTIDVGPTGFALKKPVLASACEDGCPWGELGDFLTQAMQPLGYDIIQCRNCDGAKGPPLVSKAGYPPALGIADTIVGTTTRINAPVDFGITESGLLRWAYDGLYDYAASGPFAAGTPGPFANLRLIAKIEDPTYLLVAVKTSSGITDLAQIAAQKMPVTIVGGDTPQSQPVLTYYGITSASLSSWGGSVIDAVVFGQIPGESFDVVVSELGSPANNPESGWWSTITQTYDLTFLDIPEALVTQLANDTTLGVAPVTARYGLLKGITHSIATVGRTGEAIFGREDMPEQAAHDVAMAVDQNRQMLKWFIRPYSYDSRTVWQDFDVPLHPGAMRYYQEAGYMPAAPASKGGCATTVDGSMRRTFPTEALLVPALILLMARRRGRSR
jgi:uncharacterized protein